MQGCPEGIDVEFEVKLLGFEKTPNRHSMTQNPKPYSPRPFPRMQGCPEGADVEFEVELLGFEKTPNWHSMTAADKIARAEQLRQQGNATFKQGQLAKARQKYLKALKLLDNAWDIDTDEQVLNPTPYTLNPKT